MGRAEGLKYTSTETEAATDCRYLDYDSNPAISAEVAAEREESITPTKQPRLTSSSALLSELRAREVEGRLEEVLEEEEGVGRWPD